MKNIKMTEAKFLDACDRSNGLCLKCNEIQEGGCEPDAEGYECSACGEMAVCGIEQALILGRIDIISEDEDDE